MELTHLMPQFGNAAFTTIAFVLALSIIVAIHEYGHYIVGRWCGIHAEVFSLGFGPKLFSGVDRHGTRWQVAALPFGGFVKFLGDANSASVGATDVPEADRRRTMMGAPLWARFATVLAGPVFNFILSLVLFFGLGLWQGQIIEPIRIADIHPLPPEMGQGLHVGDEIIGLNGMPTPTEDSIYTIKSELSVGGPITYTVFRDGAELKVAGPHPFPPVVLRIVPNSAASAAGLQKNDVVTSVDGQPVWSFDELVGLVKGGEGKAMLLSVWRNGQTLEFTFVPRLTDLPTGDGGFETRFALGIEGGFVFALQTETPTVQDALYRSVQQFWYINVASISGLYHLIAGKISPCNLTGPVGIAQASGAMAAEGTVSFMSFVAVLSAAIGLMNLFPIPILDGGHLVFFGYEAVTGRKPAVKVLNILMVAGLALVLFMTFFALANDLFLCP